MVNPLNQYFRLSCDSPELFEIEPLSRDQGYFAFGEGVICYGRTSRGYRSRSSDKQLYDASADLAQSEGYVRLPFDPFEVVTNLSHERYMRDGKGPLEKAIGKLVRNSYYAMRPFFPLTFRSHLQSLYLRGWERLSFPSWPVDTTVEALMKRLLLLQLSVTGQDSIPFIWFWPDGASACAIMTHDVEEEEGRAFCSTLMDINDEFAIPASFQVVPEQRYAVTPEFIGSIKSRGYEVNVQDLNHDGRLYWNLREFKHRAARINQYGREWGAIGFRAGILYRNQDWFDMLDFEYDMSTPNVAHLDPQRGGCCTVMPYFIGDKVELPVTLSQDHTLLHILHDYSLDLWKRQIAKIREHNGMISVIIHPDYIIELRARRIYRDLLAELSRLREYDNVWIAAPKDVNRWWRQRSAMTLKQKDGRWIVDGPGKERARVAKASIRDGKLKFEIESRAEAKIESRH